MNWFFIALAAPLFWAIANHTDKYLLSKYVKGGGIGSLIIFSSLFAVVVLPFIAIFNPGILSLSFGNIAILVLVGVLNTVGVLFYLYALHEDEASIVVPLFQIIPILGFVFGYFILGETTTKASILASVLVIVGAMLLSFERSGSGIRFKSRMVGFMMISTVCYALHGVLFKLVARTEDFWTSIFWEYAGLLISGVIFLIFVRSYRKEFFDLMRNNGSRVFGLNFMNETIVLIGNVLTAFAFTLAPVSLVLVVSGYQPLFVLILGVLITMFFPSIEKEKISHKFLIYKIVAIALILVGGYFLNINS